PPPRGRQRLARGLHCPSRTRGAARPDGTGRGIRQCCGLPRLGRCFLCDRLRDQRRRRPLAGRVGLLTPALSSLAREEERLALPAAEGHSHPSRRYFSSSSRQRAVPTASSRSWKLAMSRSTRLVSPSSLIAASTRCAARIAAR